MPELPEVETVCRGLAPVMEGVVIERIELMRPDLRVPIPAELPGKVKGAKVVKVSRRAKYLLFYLDNQYVIIAHLGMSGWMKVFPAKPNSLGKHDHVLIYMKSGSVIIFNDPRRFGLFIGCDESKLAAHPLLADMGPEPLEPEFDAEYLYNQLQRRKQAVKPVIMDQKLVVGVGNIYASEALYDAGILPERPANKLSHKDCSRLVTSIQKTLHAAIASGGSTLRDFVASNGESGYFQHHFQVYGKEKEGCGTCGKKILKMVQAGRATYWCKTCQK